MKVWFYKVSREYFGIRPTGTNKVYFARAIQAANQVLYDAYMGKDLDIITKFLATERMPDLAKEFVENTLDLAQRRWTDPFRHMECQIGELEMPEELVPPRKRGGIIRMPYLYVPRTEETVYFGYTRDSSLNAKGELSIIPGLMEIATDVRDFPRTVKRYTFWNLGQGEQLTFRAKELEPVDLDRLMMAINAVLS